MGDTKGFLNGIRVVRNRCLLGAYPESRVNRFRLQYNARTKRVMAIYKGFINDPNNEITAPSHLAISGKNMVVTNQNLTSLGETGQLFGSVLRIPPFNDLC